jgi:hypothetical protein
MIFIVYKAVIKAAAPPSNVPIAVTTPGSVSQNDVFCPPSNIACPLIFAKKKTSRRVQKRAGFRKVDTAP